MKLKYEPTSVADDLRAQLAASRAEVERLQAQLAAVQNESIDHGTEAFLLRTRVAELEKALERMLKESRGFGEPDEKVREIPHTSACIKFDCRYCQARAALAGTDKRGGNGE